MDFTYLVSSCKSMDIDWLQEAMAPLGKVLKAGGSLDELLRLVEVTGAGLVFVGIDHERTPAQCALIESLLEARPMLTVVGIGDGFDNQLVIAAMRAGARDFISYGLRGSEVLGLVRRLTQRLPTLPVRRDQGVLSVLYGSQPDVDAALVATHLALACAGKGGDTLLVDLGLPAAESLCLLGLEPAFGFGDALRNLRRLDAGLIDSAFSQHASGLRVLASQGNDEPLAASSSAELYLLLGALRQHFAHVVVNLCGQPDSEALQTFVGNARQVFWYVDQGVSTCRRSLAQLEAWQSRGFNLDGARLLVDRYQSNVAPDAQSLARTFDIPLAATLPPAAELRLRARNQGKTLCELAPRDKLSRTLAGLAGEIERSATGRSERGWLQRLLGRLA